MPDVNRSVELYNGVAIERVPPSALVLPRTPRFSLATAIYVGRYGEVGMGIIDRRPEKRWTTYSDLDFIGSHYTEADIEGDSNVRERPHHYLDTDQGFKVVRFVALPEAVNAFFVHERHIGAGLINKCIMDTLPEEFDEVEAHQAWAFDATGNSKVVKELLYAAVKLGNQTLIDNKSTDGIADYVGRYPYVSFHKFEDEADVMNQVACSVPASLANLDSIIGLFGRTETMPPRYISLPGEDRLIGQPQLPSANN